MKHHEEDGEAYVCSEEYANKSIALEISKLSDRSWIVHEIDDYGRTRTDS